MSYFGEYWQQLTLSTHPGAPGVKVSSNRLYFPSLAHFFEVIAALELFFRLESVAVFDEWPAVVEAVTVEAAAFGPD